MTWISRSSRGRRPRRGWCCPLRTHGCLLHFRRKTSVGPRTADAVKRAFRAGPIASVTDPGPGLGAARSRGHVSTRAEVAACFAGRVFDVLGSVGWQCRLPFQRDGCWAGVASARHWISWWRVCAPGRAGRWCCAGRPGSARARCWSIWCSMRLGGITGRPRRVGHGHGGVRRARPPRTACHRRDGAQAHRRDARRADPAGGAGRAPGRPRRDESGDRRPAVPEPPHLEWHRARYSESSGSARARNSARRCPTSGKPPSARSRRWLAGQCWSAHGPTPATRSTEMWVMYPGGGLSIGGKRTSGPR